jgi:hypothetical protein
VSTEQFYHRLQPFQTFAELLAKQNFVAVPPDWYLVITDIVSSTQAIATGHYKEVNLIGACSIAAVLNISRTLNRNIDIPFIFGGDGATMLVPSILKAPAQASLLATRQLAKAEFGLDLRVAIIPVIELIQAGQTLEVAKYQVSANYQQAILAGGGLTYAEQMVKQQGAYQVTADPDIQPYRADYSGLECRWQDIASQRGEVVSLLVLAIAPNPDSHRQIYRQVITQIEQIYGSDPEYCPVTANSLKLAFGQCLEVETKAKSARRTQWGKFVYRCKIFLENLLGWVLIHCKIKDAEVDWGHYRAIVTAAVDYKKFDDILRMIIAGDAQQRQQLVDYLEVQYQQRQLVYGYHVSNRALMTCLVFERSGRQVHFVDGADGGYTLAAKNLKQRLIL